MNYYELLKDEVSGWASPLVKCRDELIKVIENAKKSLSAERIIVQNLKARIEKLKTLSRDSLTDSDLDFAKFKTSLKKLNDELAVSESACEMLKSEILPAKQKELQDVRRRLNDKFDACFRENKPLNDKEVFALLNAAFVEKGLYAAAFHRLRQEAGCGDSGFTVPLTPRRFQKAFEVFGVAKRPQMPKRETASEQKVEQPASKTLLTGEIEPSTDEQPESPDKHNHQLVAINERTAAK